MMTGKKPKKAKPSLGIVLPEPEKKPMTTAQIKALRLQERRILAYRAFRDGEPIPLIAKRFKVTTVAVRGWIKARKLEGKQGLRAKERTGRIPKLSWEQLMQVQEILWKPPSAAGFPGDTWTGPLLVRLVNSLFGIRFNEKYAVDWMKNFGDIRKLITPKTKLMKARIEKEKSKEKLKRSTKVKPKEIPEG